MESSQKSWILWLTRDWFLSRNVLCYLSLTYSSVLLQSLEKILSLEANFGLAVTLAAIFFKVFWETRTGVLETTEVKILLLKSYSHPITLQRFWLNSWFKTSIILRTQVQIQLCCVVILLLKVVGSCGFYKRLFGCYQFVNQSICPALISQVHNIINAVFVVCCQSFVDSYLFTWRWEDMVRHCGLCRFHTRCTIMPF